jgi:uncharacterized protein
VADSGAAVAPSAEEVQVAAGSRARFHVALAVAVVSVAPGAAGAQTSVTPATPTPSPSAARDFVPPAPTQHFTDYAAFVPAAAARRLDEKLARFEARTGQQFLVVVFKEMAVLEPPVASVQDFTLRTANIWSVGRKGFERGVVLFVFVRERKLRMEVGPGLIGALPADVQQRIVDEKITPDLRRGDTAAALEAGIDAVIALLEPKPTP